jgi:F-type H+-transporting ATPase subunit delta
MTSTRARQAARRLFRRCFVAGTLDEARVRQVAARLATAGQRGTLTILTDFGRLVRLEVDRHRALVESATPLTDAFADAVREQLTAKYGPGLATSFVLNPSLIGGLRIKVGSDVVDGSVKARLAALEARL